MTPRLSRRLVWVAVLAAALVLVAAAFTLLGTETRSAVLPADDGSAADSPDPAASAGELLHDLQRALAERDLALARSLADPDAPRSDDQLAAIVANARDLRIVDVALRYVDESGLSLDPGEAGALGDDVTVVDVQLTWRLRGADRTTSTVELPLVLGWEEGRATFAGVTLADDSRVPLWLTQRLQVRRTPRTLVLATNPRDASRLDAQARVAVETVSATLPQWRGTLVVEAPRNDAQFEAASGMAAASAAAIAAVTATTDGSSLPGTPAHIYLNPALFGRIGPEGQQIVLSHEATHVAVDAVTTPVPHWLSEGFADYVALVDSDLPVDVLAAQILELVRESGPPRSLPAAAEFDGANEDIGAWYEAAWLATVLIAERYGEPALLEFFDTASDDGDTDRAFRDVLGVSEREFVRTWRERLGALAGA